jgi:ABC-type amino acid transport substrate-binding protein
VTILPEREEVIDFSEPYIDADQGLVINLEETPDVASSADLTSDMILGAQRNTTSSAYAEENFADQVAEIRLFDQTPEALADLAVGRIQVVVADFPAAAFATQTEYKDQLAVIERLTTGEQYGIAVSQDKPSILDEVNRILAEMQADGTYDEIFATWFGEAP